MIMYNHVKNNAIWLNTTADKSSELYGNQTDSKFQKYSEYSKSPSSEPTEGITGSDNCLIFNQGEITFKNYLLNFMFKTLEFFVRGIVIQLVTFVLICFLVRINIL